MKMKITSLILLSFVFFRTTGATDDDSESAVEAECAEGWTLLADTCGDTESKVCVKMAHPLKFVSWSHMQYMCDMAGGYLPEPTNTTKAQLKLILESYHQLYGETLMYLGATDVTHQNEWKWFKSKADIGDTNWGNDKQSKTDNKDCLAQSSGTGKWRNVDCEENSHEDRVAFVCMTALTPTPTPPPTSRCISGWTEFKDACYIYQLEEKTWKEASAACQKLHDGAELTSITSVEENKFLQDLSGRWVWTGAHRTGKDEPFTWSDHTLWSKSYISWGSNPYSARKYNKHCVCIDGYKLYTIVCNFRQTSLCKYSL